MSSSKKIRKTPTPAVRSVEPVRAEDDKIVTYFDIEREAGFAPPTRVHLRRLIKKKLFPRPVALSPGRIGWFLSELQQHKASRPRA